MKNMYLLVFVVFLVLAVCLIRGQAAEYDYTLKSDPDAVNCTISGVVTVDGAPTGGILVNLTLEHKYREQAHFITYSAPGGAFIFEGLAGGWYRLSACDSRYLPASVKPLFLKSKNQHLSATLNLEKGGTTVTGLVTDKNGKVVRNSHVSVVQTDNDDNWIPGSIRVPVSNTGRYEVKLKAGMNYVIYASAKGYKFEYEDYALGGEDRAEVPPLALEVETSISGRVIDESGRPVQGAEVDLTISASFMSAETDKEGRFVLVPVKTGRALTVGAYRDNLVGWTPVKPLKTGVNLSGVTIIVKPGWAIKGEVRKVYYYPPDEKGKTIVKFGDLVPNTRVICRVSELGFAKHVFTNAKGRFKAIGLPSGQAVQFFAHGKGSRRGMEGYKPVWAHPDDEFVTVPFVPSDEK